MKILVISQYYYPEPFRLNDICEELVRRGNDVTVLTGNPNYPDGEIYDGYEKGHEEEIINGVNVIRCKIRPRKKGSINLLRNYLSFWYKASLAIRKLPDTFDVVYSYQLSPITCSAPANWYAKKYHKSHFLYCLDIWPESVIESISPKTPVYKFISWLSKRIYSSADIIGVTSPSFIDYLSNLIDWPKDHFVYIPQHARDVLDQSVVVSHEKLNIVFTGNIGASQNLDVLIDAINEIKKESGFNVILVGSGSDLDRLEKKVHDLGLEHLITFTGRQPKEKMPEFYAMADFCFLSLRDEGAVSWTIPGKLQEYMSAGKPILAAINGDAKYVIEDSHCGICIDFNDFDGLAKVILFYAKNKEDLVQFGVNAREYYLKYFTLCKHVDVLESVIHKMLS